MNFPAHGSACTPRALMHLFGESFEDACRRIHRFDGDYRSVTTPVLHRLLSAAFTIKLLQVFDDQRPMFTAWRRYKRGKWVAVVTAPGYNGHCISLENGKAYDNNWAAYHGLDKLQVCGAWRVA